MPESDLVLWWRSERWRSSAFVVSGVLWLGVALAWHLAALVSAGVSTPRRG